MKKLLEVLEYGDGEIRFNTDINVNKNPEMIPDIASKAAFSMATKLWGGNEISILAVIRALSIADLSLCTHRKEMIREMESNSEYLAQCFVEAKREYEKAGGKVFSFAPDFKPSKHHS